MAIVSVVVLLALGLIWFWGNSTQPREAPEAERVLQAQSLTPFQILIPAFLPLGFDRSNVEIQTDQSGPQGEPMVRLIYSTPREVRLTLSEWIPKDAQTTDAARQVSADTTASLQACMCLCRTNGVCDLGQVMTQVGPLRVVASSSNGQLVPRNLMQAILSTLAPASGLHIFSSWEEIPLIVKAPPAVQVPVNENGIQQVMLVVSSSGYTPAHFAVKNNLPVRLTFRQLGQVGCGNELYIQWGPQLWGHLLLATPNETQVLTFTPTLVGTFPFHCPHKVFQGVMTVQE